MKQILKYLMVLVIALSSVQSLNAEVISSVTGELKLNERPLDLANTADGKLTFVLTDEGNVFIYANQRDLKDKVFVGKRFDKIEVSPRGEHLLLSSNKDKSVQILSLDFIHQIDITGSPYKGKESAPVVIAVFSDFQ